ncbi:MAG: hypothetical protein IJ719_11760 [Clostridia bacterium]|nr:hypothetical protein [Clostridia bacterium]
MIVTDESALICDLAETYHILDYRALPVKLLATLCVGLREDSRIKMKMSGAKITSEIALLAGAVDRLSMLVWAKTKDGQRGRNMPASIMSALLADKTPKDTDIKPMNSAEEFEAERRRILEGL